MNPTLEQTLRDLPKVGTLIKDRGYRQVWRFVFEDKPFYLKFFPRRGARLKRLIRGSPAMREFTRLQWLQKAKIPSARAVAAMMGFQLNGVRGDALILEGIEPAQPLDDYLNTLDLRAEPIPQRRELTLSLIALLKQLGEAGLSHADLHLGNILLKEGRLYLLDAYEISNQGLKLNHVLRLADSAGRYASRADLLRGWRALMADAPMPRQNILMPQIQRRALAPIHGDNRYIGRLRGDGWSGLFHKSTKYPRRWSMASRLTVSETDWRSQWPLLLAQIQSDQLTVIKRTLSGDVLEGQIVLAGKPVPVIVKKPRRKYWHRFINEIIRGGRPSRAWDNSWRLIVRGIPTAWPILLMERRVLGYALDGLIVYEKINGTMLSHLDLDTLAADHRSRLFQRLGRLLRRLDDTRLHHWDAKSQNFMIVSDPILGPSPLLIDVDGIRRYAHPRREMGLHRLLRSMKDHPQYTPVDSFWLCRGYAPFARVEPEKTSQTSTEPESTEATDARVD